MFIRRSAAIVSLAVTLVWATAPIVRASDSIELYADEAMVNCTIVDATPRVLRVYIFHVGTGLSRNVIFRALTPACWVGATWLGDIVPAPFFKQNSTHGDGIIIQYDDCIEPPGYIAYMNFTAYGQGLPCCEYRAGPHVDLTSIAVSTCDPFIYRSASARPVIINANASCPCDQPVPVAETTWGKVKSLYQ